MMTQGYNFQTFLSVCWKVSTLNTLNSTLYIGCGAMKGRRGRESNFSSKFPKLIPRQTILTTKVLDFQREVMIDVISLEP